MHPLCTTLTYNNNYAVKDGRTGVCAVPHSHSQSLSLSVTLNYPKLNVIRCAAGVWRVYGNKLLFIHILFRNE